MNTRRRRGRTSPISVLVVVILGCTAASARAQTWEWVNPYPTGEQILDIAFVDQNQGWAVGGRGTILHSTDGGKTWTKQESGVQAVLRGADFVDEHTGWAIGGEEHYVGEKKEHRYRGIVLHTTDGGGSWQEQLSDSSSMFSDVEFIDRSTGWIVGEDGVILHTTNAGATWSAQESGAHHSLVGVAFADGQTGCITASPPSGLGGVLLATTTGGSTWTPAQGIETDFWWSHGVAYSHSGRAFAAGKGLWCSMDRGTTWEKVKGPDTTWFYDVAFADNQNGWAAGLHGLIVRTADGGTTWSVCGKARYRELSRARLCFPDHLNGWLVGTEIGDTWDEVTLRTTDGGESWASWLGGVDEMLRDLAFADSSNGWAVTTSRLWRTRDGGTSWDSVSIVGMGRLGGVAFPDPRNGWLVGVNGTILHTSDGGETWSPLNSGTTAWLASVLFVDSLNGWVDIQDPRRGSYSIGDALHTIDGGQTWTRQNAKGPFTFLDAQRGWSVSGCHWDASLRKMICTLNNTTDGGDTWREIYLGNGEFLSNIVFVNERLGWATGGGEFNGTIAHTTDGGRTWIEQLHTDFGPSGIVFLDSVTGWLVGGTEGSGTILGTTDGGKTWSEEFRGTHRFLNDVVFTDTGHGWAWGYPYTILRYRDRDTD